jgi:hypothetical protein
VTCEADDTDLDLFPESDRHHGLTGLTRQSIVCYNLQVKLDQRPVGRASDLRSTSYGLPLKTPELDRGGIVPVEWLYQP